MNKPNIDPIILIIVIFTLLLLGIGVYFGTKTGATAEVKTDDQVSLSIDSNKFDWGTIDMDNGIVSKSFDIKNTSDTILKLYDVKTSCMCTTAQLKTNSYSSPKFKMHDKNPNIYEVKPGEAVELIVEFDPAYHGPSGTGPVNRTITMNTNDSKNPELSFELTAVVIKK